MKSFIAGTFFASLYLLSSIQASAADWPMWRRDSARSAESQEKLPAELHLRWVCEYPKLKPAYREKRLQFDAGYEPIVLGKQMFVASSYSDCVTALNTDNGEHQWTFYVEGAVRCAPVAWGEGDQARVLFGSDDGNVYCLNASDGRLVWKFRAAPSGRKVLAGGRMISLWPVRGGPVLHEGRVYLAAGVWPFEGVFIYCLDAATGKVVWRSDDASFVYGVHPHAAEALGGVTPQGYLVVAGDELIVPCGQALPARFDLATGKLKSFELPRPGRKPGGWFASASVRRGEVKLDANINRDLHEDKVYQGPGSPGIRTKITIGEKTFRFEERLAGVKGEVHTMLAADDKLFVVTLAGEIYCFGEKPETVLRHAPERGEKGEVDLQEAAEAVDKLLATTKARDGYVLIRGAKQDTAKDSSIDRRRRAQGAINLTTALLLGSKFRVVLTDSDNQLLEGLCRFYLNQRDRVDLLGNNATLDLPPYFASMMVWPAETAPGFKDLNVLRPNGGVACCLLSKDEHKRLATLLGKGDQFSVERQGDITVIRRGELSGAANYTGKWVSPDQLVKAPLGVLWFDDTLGYFKRSPQPWFVDGVMISYPKDWMEKHRKNRKPPYDLLPPVFSDVYTGRVIDSDEAVVADLQFPRRSLNDKQPNQYRPPTQKNAWKPKQPIIGKRRNPLTGKEEPRAIPKSYGCDGGVDYGYMYTMRSGTPAFYDKRLESGVCNISGPRSGCTNSIIPAGGVLNVPFFYEGCTCSYPLPVGLALVSMPPEHEQWAAWGPGKSSGIQRVGVNFGAPGDRMTEAGTLWLDYPSRGGPSPEVSVTVEPKSATYFYQHSLFVKRSGPWPWVVASGVEGAKTITVAGLKPGNYTARLYFLNERDEPRKFDVSLNGKAVAEALDIVKETGERMTGLVRQYENVSCSDKLEVTLSSKAGRTILCGLEIVKDGLVLDK